MARQRQKRNEFRKINKKDGRRHPAYIYEKIGDEFRFIGITHSPITKETENIKLEKNPNPKDRSTAYVRPFPNKAKVSSFGKKIKGWFFGEKDKEKIEQIKKK